MKKINIGLLGVGQIGTGLYALVQKKRKSFIRDMGVEFNILKAAVKHLHKKRKIQIPKNILTDNASEVVKNPQIDVVVELIGGTQEARRLVLEALENGKHVVTANKALLAEHGDEILQCAYRNRRWILFEASVGGGIPVIKALREGLAANQIDSIHAIINGTTNYILSRMSENHMDFAEALKEAQAKGYAEADPSFDIQGKDAAHKLAILTRFAFGGRVKFDSIYCEGITRIRREDIAFAEEFGYRIKLLAIAKKSGQGIEARVQPTLLPEDHILANVNGAFNAVLLHGDEVGDSLLYGRGAGPQPTASAVFSDLADIALRSDDRLAAKELILKALRAPLKIKNISNILSRYYMRFHVVDKPGVLSRISRIFGRYRLSISNVIQREESAGNVVPLIFLTHAAHEKDVRQAIRVIDRLEVTRGKSQVIRIEDENGIKKL